MENEATDRTTLFVEKEIPIPDATFYKSFAFGGPAINFVVRLPDLEIIFGNTRFEQLLGYSTTDECEKIHLPLLMDEYNIGQFMQHMARVTDCVDAQSEFTTYRLKNRSGNFADYHLYASAA